MLDPYEATVRWKKIAESVSKIKDPILQESFLAIYKERAIKEWGFCPDKKNYTKKEEKIVLEPWQQEIYDKLKLAKEYGVWEKDKKTEAEFRIRMKDYITKGGKFSDLPQELQNKYTLDIYLTIMYEEIKNCIDFLEKK